jgi:hypothetical protein
MLRTSLPGFQKASAGSHHPKILEEAVLSVSITEISLMTSIFRTIK